MRAAVNYALDGHFEVEDTVDIADPIGNEVLIEVKASGLCHSDLHVAESNFGYPLPMILGHELAGVVLAVGPEVASIAPGDHVVGSLVQFCGDCAACREGRTYQCGHPQSNLRPADFGPRLSIAGKPVSQGWGVAAFAERALVHENQLAVVPDELPFAQAALLGCSTVTGAGAAINSAGVRPGQSVAVVGVGGVGLNVIAGARLAGAQRIIAIDLQPTKAELARTFGATDFVDAGAGDAVAKVLELTGGGVDHAFEVIGLKSTTEQAIAMARRGGSAYLIGMHRPGSRIEIDPLTDMVVMQKKIQGVYMGSSNIKHDIPMYAQLYLQGRLNLDDLISREIAIDDINDAYDELKSGAIARSVITAF